MDTSPGSLEAAAAAHPACRLEHRETRFLALRSAPADLASAFTEAFAAAVGSGRLSAHQVALRRTGEAVVAAVLSDAEWPIDLPYHNPHHVAEATLAMGWLCASARALNLLSADDAALGVVAMVGHDLGHDGKSVTDGILEARAAVEVTRIAREAGLDEPSCARLSDIILGTDPATVRDNAERSAMRAPPGPFGHAGDLLRSLANEADVMASLMPTLGPRLGILVARERELAGDPKADLIGRYSHQLAFLRAYAWFTPAASAIGMADLVRRRIEAFARAGQAPGAATTPEDGAAALDRLDRGAAEALYREAFDALALDSGTTRNDTTPTEAEQPFRVSLTVTILTAFSVVFLTVMGFTTFATYHQTMVGAIAAAERSMADLTSRTAARASALVEPLHATVTVAPLLAHDGPDFTATNIATIPTLGEMLGVLPQASAVSLADDDGILLRVFDVGAMAADRREALAAPAGTRLVARQSDRTGLDQLWFLDASGRSFAQQTRPRVSDPLDEVWFHTARQADGVGTTVLHPLADLGVPGVSIVRRLPGGNAIGLDIVLDSLGGFLREQRISARSQSFIIDDNGILIAHSDQSIAMGRRGAGDAHNWITIASSSDPILRAFWSRFSIGTLRPDVTSEFTMDDEVHLVRVTPLTSIGSPPLLIAVVAPLSDFTGPILQARNWTLMLSVLACAVGLGLIAIVARWITRPLAALTREAEAVRRFELDQTLQVPSRITEVARLAATMQAMKAALHTFGLYVPKYLVREIVRGDGEARIGGQRRIITVMFTDIVGFTTIADGLDAERLTQLTSEYFEGMTGTLMEAGGTIDKYIGDGIMVLWNAPNPYPAHAGAACLAALRCRLLSERMERGFAQRGWPGLLTRIGLNTGEAVVGNVGSSDRLSYTAIGATVNLAARLEGLNRQYGTHVLVSDETRQAAGPRFVFRRVDRVLAKGRQQPTDLYELLGLRHADTPADAALVLNEADIAWAETWDRIVTAYLQRRFTEAQAILAGLDSGRQDTLAELFAARIERFVASPPPEDWHGVTAYDVK